jgi:gliding motility-associated-like protein
MKKLLRSLSLLTVVCLFMTQSSVAQSSDATLASLSLTVGTLSPGFVSTTENYTTAIANTFTSTTVTATKNEGTATMKINGVTATGATTITLAPGSNDIIIVVTAGNGTTTKQYKIVATRAPSTIATLTSLSGNSGTLSPAYSASIFTYTSAVANTVSSYTVTANRAESTATMKVKGVTVAGSSTVVPLVVGLNAIDVVMVAGDGTTTLTYTINVTRAAPSTVATLSNLTAALLSLTPSFNSATTAYTFSVVYAANSISVSPTRTEATATIKVNNVTVASGASSASIPLNVGSNIITTVVTAGDGTTTKTYTVTVTRAAASTVATLSGVVLTGGGTLSPAFTAANGSYTSTVGVSTITVAAIKTDANATIRLNGVTVTSGTATTVGLVIGNNNFSFGVTAQDGTTTKLYVFNITRTAPSTVATLSALTTTAGPLTPAFTSANGNYTYTTVLATTTSTTVTATRTEANATIKVNGVTTASGSPSAAINLFSGFNVVTVLVTASNGTTTKEYNITILRPALSSVNTLSNLLATSAISPAFNPSVTSYTVSIPATSDNLTLNATATNTDALIRVGGVIRSGSFNLPIALGATLTVVFEVTATDGTKKEYTLVATRPIISSKVATLVGLNYYTPIGNTVRDFSAEGSTSYSVKASRLLTSMSISSAVTNPGSIMKINGVETAPSIQTPSIPFGDTPLVYTISVLSTDNTTTKTYTLTITKDGPSADLNRADGGFTLTPAFNPAITSYTGIVSNATQETAFTFTPLEATSTVKINGVTTTDSRVGIPLPVLGVNPIVVEVTNATGLTKTYTFNITRVAPQVADLSGLRIFSSGLTSPSFTPLINDYSISVINDSTSVQVIATLFTAGATMKINGVSVVPPARPSINLAVGSNNVSVVVTSADGLTTKTYTLKIIRAAVGGTIPPSTGLVTLSPTANEVTVNSPTLAITVTIPAGTVNPGVNFSSLITGGTGIIPQTTMISDVSSVSIPAATKVTSSDPNWNGVIGAPVVTNYDIPNPEYGQVALPGLVIEVGSHGIALSFDKAVRLILPGQAEKNAAMVHGTTYRQITTIGTEDSQAAGDALPVDGAFKMNVGADLVIWTKAFSTFLTYSPIVDLNVAVVAADMDALTADVIKGANADLDHITTVLVDPLPAVLAGGSTVTWSSSKPAVISADGKTVIRPIMGTASEVVTLTANVKKGAISENKTFTLTAIILPNQAPTLNAIANQTLCFTTAAQAIALSGITAGPEAGQKTTLSVSSSNATLLKQLSVDNTTGIISFVPSNTAGGTTTITVTVKDDAGTANGGVDTFTRTFTLVLYPQINLTIDSSIGTSVSKGFTADLNANGAVSYTWATAAGIISGQNTASLRVRPSVTTTYTVTALNANGCSVTKSITITILDDYRALDVANILTPNGDGKNDALIIKNLDMYTNNTLKIFDRGGRQVYVKQNYNNDWTGTLDGAALAQDTYYYILDFGSGKGQLKGFVSIVK